MTARGRDAFLENDFGLPIAIIKGIRRSHGYVEMRVSRELELAEVVVDEFVSGGTSG